jgi:hypothetical protein
MGRVAAELLFRMIDQNLNREEVSDVILAPRLVVRQSTASSLSSPSRRAIGSDPNGGVRLLVLNGGTCV